eukprot:TRINITY_DN4570_c0_g1_i1.p1 TRINITY_DN4570_c0_g1~~TRINITY_DN4570_c0_g1_i1.p1  ORF type:complete len:176 (-),score=38.89 TRINITY_DN4570_c0_g1_i1:17-544(-)
MISLIATPSFRYGNSPSSLYSFRRFFTRSYVKVKRWVSNLEKYCNAEELVVVLVGNKADLNPQRCVTTEEGTKLAAQMNLFFIETSAKDDLNITDAFAQLTREIMHVQRPDPGQQQQQQQDKNNNHNTSTRMTLLGASASKDSFKIQLGDVHDSGSDLDVDDEDIKWQPAPTCNC